MIDPLATRFVRLSANTRGRDYLIGDIHGHFSRVARELERIGFDDTRDRLICVGDLVDRGPESPAAAEWLRRPWFHSVIGNHDAAILHRAGYISAKFELFTSDHGWFDALERARQQELCAALAAMPWALELATPSARIGIVHAEVPERFRDWDAFAAALGDGLDVLSLAVSNRYRARRAADLDAPEAASGARLDGVEWVVHGHTPRRGCRPGRLGNRLWIDTMGWRDCPVELGTPRFTLVDALAPLRPL